jgi:hypothetical protein
MDERSEEDLSRHVHTIREELLREFAGRVPPHEVEQAVQETAGTFRGVRIRSFVPILLRRESRDRLRRLGRGRRA